MKIEDRIAEIIWHKNIWGGISDTKVAKKLAKNILALISQVECGECGGTDWPCQNLHGGRGEAIYSNLDGLCKHDECKPHCQTCKGTGYRKVMVRRDCPACNIGKIKTWHGDEDTTETLCYTIITCSYCNGTNTKVTPFTPDDLIDVINKTATLELEGEG